jgi:hypothetical protein
MDALEKQARELLAAEYRQAGRDALAQAILDADSEQRGESRAVGPPLRAIVAALRQSSGSPGRWVPLSERSPPRNETVVYWHRGGKRGGFRGRGYLAIADEWQDEHHAAYATHWLDIAPPMRETNMQDLMNDDLVHGMVKQTQLAMSASRLEAAILDLQPLRFQNKGTRLYQLYPDAETALADVRAALARAHAIDADHSPDAGKKVPLVVQTAPERIWLQCGDEYDTCNHHFSDLGDVTWSADQATHVGIEYVRADLSGEHPQPPVDLRQFRDAVDLAVHYYGNQLNIYRAGSDVRASLEAKRERYLHLRDIINQHSKEAGNE